eukprot:CAMPEP_0206530524 /NCGR_PEP_ID=MMETSP0325_2-20121206/3227_1 /ASSEMBLY_ACC=CAM_ASM_000347 /TAXON_ID=2866 /ORGANISM="Crypthecodinium cohnii, Strain Seligo" /LENGTH=141 /DNA_ID=CAMNT_0054026605 /DNA_START=853 /DNA_END=1278 /DNA_ORIENTATION=-
MVGTPGRIWPVGHARGWCAFRFLYADHALLALVVRHYMEGLVLSTEFQASYKGGVQIVEQGVSYVASVQKGEIKPNPMGFVVITFSSPECETSSFCTKIFGGIENLNLREQCAPISVEAPSSKFPPLESSLGSEAAASVVE